MQRPKPSLWSRLGSLLLRLRQQLIVLGKSLRSRQRSALPRRVPINRPAQPRLDEIDHIIVLMMENRSFDHMLGYLGLEGGLPGLDGLQNAGSNQYQGKDYSPFPLGNQTAFPGNPHHGGADVADQLADDNGGFVRNFATTGAANPEAVMGYYTGDQLPVYDHLARNFTVCHRWFSSVPGATWPNRLYAVAGAAAGSHDNLPLLPYYWMRSFPRHLDAAQKTWRWYSYDPASLRFIDSRYRFRRDEHFAFVEQRTPELVQENIEGLVLAEGPSFIDDIADENLQAVSWIDPNFTDFHVIPHSNDDHPPADVHAGQELALTIYRALAESRYWDRCMLVLVYDEHGGLYDHVKPDPAPDDDPRFRSYGVRVPALIVSPWCEPGSVSKDVFDHTSIIKTLLLRFCAKDGQIPNMGQRVTQAQDLSVLLRHPTRRDPPDISALVELMANARAEQAKQQALQGLAQARRPQLTQVDDLQAGILRGAQHLRRRKLPAGRP